MAKLDPARLQEIRRFHEEEVEVANDSEGFPGELTEEVHIIQDLLTHIAAQETELEDTRAAYQLTRHQLDAHRAGQGTYEGITR